ncbi:hypothetical protein FRC07_008199 [Ceratobasidium sp. 392]|nr:hypothetical protein FRC07_008199 [Ceratobasidium sp. 392]
MLSQSYSGQASPTSSRVAQFTGPSQHQRAVQEQKRQQPMQFGLNNASKRLSFGAKPSTSQLSSSTTFSRSRDELELEYRQNMLERATKRARDVLESARTPRKEFSHLLAELSDICKDTAPVDEAPRKRETVAKFVGEEVSDKDLHNGSTTGLQTSTAALSPY